MTKTKSIIAQIGLWAIALTNTNTPLPTVVQPYVKGIAALAAIILTSKTSNTNPDGSPATEPYNPYKDYFPH